MRFDMTLRRRGNYFAGEFFCANVFVWPYYPAGWKTAVQRWDGHVETFRSISLRDALRAGRLALEDAALAYERQ